MVQLDDVNGRRAAARRPAEAERALPSRWQAALFVGKAWCFRAKRRLRDPAALKPRRLERKPIVAGGRRLAASQSPLYANEAAGEQALQAGKVQNLRVAARYLHGLVIPAGEVFRFWAQVPRPTRRLGFVRGRELREGCVIASVGGGLCQLSNALYDAALTAGCAIVERHAHSRRLPGSMAALGRDATIFWNYVDLRFRPAADCQLEVTLDRDRLTVALRALGSADAVSAPVVRAARSLDVEVEDATGSCDSCGMTACFRNEPAPARLPATGAAWLVDAWWPEQDAYLRERAGPQDWLFTPLDSLRLGIGPYRWNSAGFAAVRQAPWLVAARSWRSRRLARQGAARQRALLEMDEALARHYARSLPFAATHLVVSQTLLPFLWREGALGGRSFDVRRRPGRSHRRSPTSAPTRRCWRPRARHSPPPAAGSRRIAISRGWRGRRRRSSRGSCRCRVSSATRAGAASPFPPPRSAARARTSCVPLRVSWICPCCSAAPFWKVTVSGMESARRPISVLYCKTRLSSCCRHGWKISRAACSMPSLPACPSSPAMPVASTGYRVSGAFRPAMCRRCVKLWSTWWPGVSAESGTAMYSALTPKIGDCHMVQRKCTCGFSPLL
jgi:hypothetical protein